jgi:hypothetical protein
MYPRAQSVCMYTRFGINFGVSFFFLKKKKKKKKENSTQGKGKGEFFLGGKFMS